MMPKSTIISPRNALIAGALIAAGGIGYAFLGGDTASNLVAQEASKTSADTSELMQKGPLDENILGSADAPVTLIEYSSMTCGHCATFHNKVLPKIKEKYIDTGKVRYIIREFPLDDLAAGAFMLARCVGPERYFAFVDVLYANQEKWAFTKNPLPELLNFAKQAGFTEQRFNQCLSDQKLLDGINWVKSRGETKFRVRATPSFFINGQLLPRGEASVEALERAIEPLLKSS